MIYRLELSNYNMEYFINYPSKAFDYDYDEERRFVSTYIQGLIFYDKITNFKNIVIKFSPDVCYKFIYGLNQMISNGEKTPLLLTLKDVFINDRMFPSIITFYRFDNGNIQISILDQRNDKEYILLNIDDIEKIIKLLQIEI